MQQIRASLSDFTSNIILDEMHFNVRMYTDDKYLLFDKYTTFSKGVAVS